MKITIKRFDKELPMPEYKTSGAVGFDLYTRNEEKIRPRSLALLPSNLGVAVPKGYYLQLFGRSSTPQKYGLLVFPGVVDLDFHGDDDEIQISVYNFTNETVKIPKGTRIAQGIFIKVGKFNFQENKKMSKKSRGGFGTTGEN